MKKILLLFALTVACVNTTPSMAQNNRHEVRMGVGAVWYPELGYVYYEDNDPHYDETYLGDKIGTPAINLTYSYQSQEWLSFGAVLSYSGTYQKSYNLYTDDVDQNFNHHFIGLIPMVRFDWFRRANVKLYSSIGLGLGYYIGREKPRYASQITRSKGFTPAIDFSPIGISVGQNFFGFCEFGLSSTGLARIGVGYRFNDKSKK